MCVGLIVVSFWEMNCNSGIMSFGVSSGLVMPEFSIIVTPACSKLQIDLYLSPHFGKMDIVRMWVWSVV
jgi:hypothetical protein